MNNANFPRLGIVQPNVKPLPASIVHNAYGDRYYEELAYQLSGHDVVLQEKVLEKLLTLFRIPTHCVEGARSGILQALLQAAKSPSVSVRRRSIATLQLCLAIAAPSQALLWNFENSSKLLDCLLHRLDDEDTQTQRTAMDCLRLAAKVDQIGAMETITPEVFLNIFFLAIDIHGRFLLSKNDVAVVTTGTPDCTDCTDSDPVEETSCRILPLAGKQTSPVKETYQNFSLIREQFPPQSSDGSAVSNHEKAHTRRLETDSGHQEKATSPALAHGAEVANKADVISLPWRILRAHKRNPRTRRRWLILEHETFVRWNKVPRKLILPHVLVERELEDETPVREAAEIEGGQRSAQGGCNTKAILSLPAQGAKELQHKNECALPWKIWRSKDKDRLRHRAWVVLEREVLVRWHKTPRKLILPHVFVEREIKDDEDDRKKTSALAGDPSSADMLQQSVEGTNAKESKRTMKTGDVTECPVKLSPANYNNEAGAGEEYVATESSAGDVEMEKKTGDARRNSKKQQGMMMQENSEGLRTATTGSEDQSRSDEIGIRDIESSMMARVAAVELISTILSHKPEAVEFITSTYVEELIQLFESSFTHMEGWDNHKEPTKTSGEKHTREETCEPGRDKVEIVVKRSDIDGDSMVNLWKYEGSGVNDAETGETVNQADSWESFAVVITGKECVEAGEKHSQTREGFGCKKCGNVVDSPIHEGASSFSGVPNPQVDLQMAVTRLLLLLLRLSDNLKETLVRLGFIDFVGKLLTALVQERYCSAIRQECNRSSEVVAGKEEAVVQEGQNLLLQHLMTDTTGAKFTTVCLAEKLSTMFAVDEEVQVDAYEDIRSAVIAVLAFLCLTVKGKLYCSANLLYLIAATVLLETRLANLANALQLLTNLCEDFSARQALLPILLPHLKFIQHRMELELNCSESRAERLRVLRCCERAILSLNHTV